MIRLLVLSSLLLVYLLVQPQTRNSAQTETLVNVCAANYFRNTIAFDSIVAAFGSQLATATVVAGDADPQTPGIQLPTVLGGVSVRVAGKLAPLFFVSPGQINYLVPPGLRVEDLNDNFATVEVVNGGNVVASGRAPINRVAPAFFTFDSSGSGLPAALIARVKPDDSQIIEALAENTGAPRGLRARLVDVSPADERVFLVVYLSGVRHATDTNRDENVNENIRVLLNGYEVELYYAGAQRELAGLDQINVQIPRAFYGEAKLQLTVQWKEKAGVEVSTEVPLATPPVTSVNWTARGLNQSAINCLAANEVALLAGTAAGIFRSLDGANWLESNFSANTQTLVHAGGSEFHTAGPWRSIDHGAKWEPDLAFQHDQFLFVGRTILTLARFDVVFAGTNQGLVWRSGTIIRGISPKGIWDAIDFPNVPVRALAKNFQRGFAGTDGLGVFSSNTTGLSWTASNQGLPANAKVNALTASAHYIFAIINDNKLYRSPDNGATWEPVTNGLPNNVPFTALASYGRNIFAGTQGSGVYLSTDFGLNWNAVNSGLNNLDVRSLLSANGRLYAGTSAGVFAADSTISPSKLPKARAQLVSTAEDTPAAIRLAATNPQVGNVSYSIVTPPQNGTLSGTLPNVTYTPRENYNGADVFTFTVSDGVLTSPPARVELNISPVNDPPTLAVRGKTNTLTGEISAVEIIATDIEDGTATITPTNLPANATFTPGNPASYVSWLIGTPGAYPITLTATDSGPQPLSVTQTVTLNVAASPEQTSWTTATLPAFRFLLALFADAAGAYLGLDSSDGTGPVQTTVVRSLDNGNSWTPFNNGLANVNAPQKFGSGNGYLYVGTQNGVWRTANNSAGWVGITDNLAVASKQVWDLAVSGDKVAVALPNGCHLSLNRGESWATIRTCTKVAFSGNTLFVDAYVYDNGIKPEGLFLTNDNGANWQAAGSGLQQFKYISRLHGLDNTLCVFSSDLTNERIFCTSDLGRTWKSFSLDGLRNTNYSTFKGETLTSIALSGNTIFVGTNPFGVYVSRDGGTTWLPANLGLPQPLNVRDLWIRGDTLFAASVRFNPPYGGNIFVRKLASN